MRGGTFLEDSYEATLAELFHDVQELLVEVTTYNDLGEPGEAEKVRNQTLRILKVTRDTLQQDKTAQTIICGDFNKQLPHVAKELRKTGFVGVF